MPVVARHLAIHGHVQGVFYRNWMVGTARRLDLTGWVRNRTDGSVEAIVQGEAEAVERLISMAQAGPPAANVTRIDVAPVGEVSFTTFEKRPTA